MKKICLVLFSAFLQFTVASTVSGQTDKKTLTERIMERSGMNEQIRQLPTVASSILSQSKGKVPLEIFNMIERETVKALDPEKILKEVSRQVEKNLNRKSMEGVLTWLDSDLGKKITAMEKVGSSAEGLRGMEEYVKSLTKTPAPKSRQDLVQRFIKATHYAEMFADITISMTLTMGTAVNLALPRGKQKDANVIRKQVEELRPKIEEEAQRTGLLSSLYIYRQLKDEEFQRYVEFAESKNGKIYHQVTFSALRDAMKRVSADLGKALGEYFKRIALSGRVVLRMKDGATLRWNNLTEKGNQYCTERGGGEICINKKEVSSVEPDE